LTSVLCKRTRTGVISCTIRRLIKCASIKCVHMKLTLFTLLQIELIDFGASRSYSKEFMDDWYLLLSAAIRGDRQACETYSLKLGYLTGEESPVRCFVVHPRFSTFRLIFIVRRCLTHTSNPSCCWDSHLRRRCPSHSLLRLPRRVLHLRSGSLFLSC
jgi:hypothetical protein